MQRASYRRNLTPAQPDSPATSLREFVSGAYTVYLSRTVSFVKGQGIDIPDEFLAQVAPLPWSHIALTGDYFWNEIDQPLERFRPIRANRFNPKSFVFP